MIEEQEEDEETIRRKERVRRKAKGLEKEPLEGLSTDLQEALIVEDLLFVLMVRFKIFTLLSVHERLTVFSHICRVSKVGTSSTTLLTHRKTISSECKVLSSSLTRG